MNNLDCWGNGVKTLTVCDLYISAASQQTKEQKKRGIGERWRSGGRTFPLDTSELEAKQTVDLA